jgi:hypothetical protein
MIGITAYCSRAQNRYGDDNPYNRRLPNLKSHSDQPNRQSLIRPQPQSKATGGERGDADI